MRALTAAFALCAGLACALPAQAAWPEKPITFVVPYSAGGATDLLVRSIAPHLEKSLGAKFVVVNRTGASGEIGMASVAASPPDGYTIGLIVSPPVVSVPIERASALHWEKLDLLGNLVDDPCAFTVHKDSPIRTVADLVAEAKKRPGAISVGTTGTGSDDHLAMVALERAAGIKFNHIPFKGGADVRAALTGKQIEVASMNIGEGTQGARTGMPYHNLGQMSRTRSPLAPDVPTFVELGYDLEMAALRGLAAPRGLPPDIRDRLVKAVAEAMANPAYRARITEAYQPLRYLAPEDFARELRTAERELRRLWTQSPWSDK